MANQEVQEEDFVRELLRECDLPRDALPYTREFDSLRNRFLTRFELTCSNHEFWKLVSRVAKKGGLSIPGTRKRAPQSRSPSRDGN